MQGNPEEYEAWLAKRKSSEFSNFRLFAGGFCVWALLLSIFVMLNWSEPKSVVDVFFSCCTAAMAVVWMKGK